MVDRPAFASDRTAAKLLDMKPAEFCALVDAGHLPKPVDVAVFKRWDTEHLISIWRGDAANGSEAIEW